MPVIPATQEDHGAGIPGQKARRHLQNSQSKKARGVLCGKVPTSQVQSPEFKPQYCQVIIIVIINSDIKKLLQGLLIGIVSSVALQ
jgi:Na+/phosphate symporter